MVPKPALKEVKSQIPRLGPQYRKPITTKEKLDAAAAKEKKPVKARSPPPDPNPDVEPKKRKARYMPPPDEIPSAIPRVKLGKAVNSRRRVAVTTKEKQIEADNKKRINARVVMEKRKAAKAAELAKKKAEEEGRADVATSKPAKRGKTAIPRDPSAHDLLENQASPSVIQYTGLKKAKGKGVLFRPTARAVIEKSAIANQAEVAKRTKKTPAVPQFKDVFKPGKKEDVFRLMDLAKEIRNRIWKLVVVHHPSCVWPAGQKHGREQPDLSMTSKEVRAEVLPVFYGLNVFTIDITPVTKASKVHEAAPAAAESEDGDTEQADAGPKDGEDSAMRTISKPDAGSALSTPVSVLNLKDGVAEIAPWVKALESGDHLSKIQHWAFSSMPEVMMPGKHFPVLDEDKSLIVYLHLRREAIDGAESVQDGDRDNTVWRASVEVHGDPRCMVPRNEQYQRCVVQMTPNWLNGMVDLALRKTDQDGTVTAGTLLGLARILRRKVNELVEYRCQLAA